MKTKQNSTQRRLPRQARARNTVDNILRAAEDIIAEEGAGDVKMRHIAERAQVPIGSVYMYFPNREAIIRAITNRYHALIDAALQEKVTKIDSPGELLRVLGECVDEYFEFMRSSPSLLNLWTGSAHNRMLAQLSIEDSKRTAQILYRAALPFLSPSALDRANYGLLVCVDMIGSISLVAATQNRKVGDKIIKEMRYLILTYVADLLADKEKRKKSSNA